jgi:precorrin-2 dehydrogenase/sirohydrochlorin ferrochelatase
MMHGYPLMLDLSKRLTVVVGAGAVGQRKITSLLEAGAHVKVIALAIRGTLPSNISLLFGPYAPHHLDGATLVFAAATPEVNARVVADAKARGILVNSADDSESGDFFVPATVRRGDLLIAVSTGGAAPAVAKLVRERLESEYDDAWGVWLALLAEVRRQVLDEVGDPEVRRDTFERLADPSWLERIRSEGREVVRAALGRVVAEARGR